MPKNMVYIFKIHFFYLKFKQKTITNNMICLWPGIEWVLCKYFVEWMDGWINAFTIQSQHISSNMYKELKRHDAKSSFYMFVRHYGF